MPVISVCCFAGVMRKQSQLPPTQLSCTSLFTPFNFVFTAILHTAYSDCNYLAIVNAFVLQIYIIYFIKRKYLYLWLCLMCVPPYWPLSESICGRYAKSSVLYLCTKFETDSSIRSKVISRVPEFWNWVTWPRPRSFMGQFVFPTLEVSIFYLCTKFEPDRLIHSKVMGSTRLSLRHAIATF